jgi:hypothetical protein
MGAIDQFLAATVQRWLEPGEAITGMGFSLDNPGRDGLVADYAVSTTKRVIVLGGGSTAFTHKPLAEVSSSSPSMWWYDEIERASVARGNLFGRGEAVTMTIHARPQMGPPGWPFKQLHFFSTAEGLDDQYRFREGFPTWLAAQVAAGAFPIGPEKAARMEAERQQRIVEYQKRAAESAARMETILKWSWVPCFVIGAVGALFVLIIGGHAVFNLNANDLFSLPLPVLAVAGGFGGGFALRKRALEKSLASPTT